LAIVSGGGLWEGPKGERRGKILRLPSSITAEGEVPLILGRERGKGKERGKKTTRYIILVKGRHPSSQKELREGGGRGGKKTTRR